MTSKSFLHGAFILSVAGLIVKVMGALYRIPLARLIGGEGIGLYQMAYPIYTMLLALSTAGIPVAISILVSEKQAKDDDKGAKRVFFVSLSILAVIGFLITLLLIINTKWIVNNVLFDPRAYYALIAISPAIFVTAISSAFRGYFQGNQTMVPTALSQVIEQFIRVGTVLALAYIFLPRGIEYAAAGAAFGAVTGSLAALFVLVIAYISFRNKRQKNAVSLSAIHEAEPVITLMKRITALALPISIGGLVVPIMQVIDATIIPTRLQDAGYTISRATELFGQFSGMANVLINLPPIITISVAISLVPTISEAIAKNQLEDARYRINLALWMTFLIGLPAAAGLFILATPIAEMLFKIPEVGKSIAVLAPSTLLLGLYQTTRGALQGMGKTYIPVINLTVGIILKGSLNYILVGIPALGIQGAGIATVTGFTASVFLNYYYVKKYTALKMNWKRNVTIPLICTTLMAILTFLVYELAINPLGNTLAVVLAITTGMMVYSFSLLLLGGVKVKDLNSIPRIGPKIARFLTSIKIFKS